MRLKEQKVELSPEAEKDLIEMCQAVMAATHISMEVFASDDFDRLQEAEWLENVVDDLEERCVDKHMERLLNNTCNPVCGVVLRHDHRPGTVCRPRSKHCLCLERKIGKTTHRKGLNRSREPEKRLSFLSNQTLWETENRRKSGVSSILRSKISPQGQFT